MIKTFEDLDVWKRSCQLAVDVYQAFKSSKDFALKDQMQRAAVSIPSNIAEGAERDSTKEYIKFLRYSKGSCGELRTQLYIHLRLFPGLSLYPHSSKKQRSYQQCSSPLSTPSSANSLNNNTDH